MNNAGLKEVEKEILENIQICLKCRMCVDMCPTYEGWFAQSSAGRLMAVNLHIKYGLGSEEELGKLLFSCTTCRRCQSRCRMLSTDCSPADTIIKARQYLVKRAASREGKRT